MDIKRLEELLGKFRGARVAVIGDYCLDAYWDIDPDLAGVSHETGKPTRPVREQSYSLGGAGNVVSNLAALGIDGICAVGVVCRDLFGAEMSRLLAGTGADTSGMILQETDWCTPVYGKVYIRGEEQNRIDFGVCSRMQPETERNLLQALENVLPSVHAVVVNQQLDRGIHSKAVIAGINRLVEAYPEKLFLVDSRDRNDCFQRVIHRMNAHEAARVCGKHVPVTIPVSEAEARRFAQKIEAGSRRPAFVSLGAAGSLVCRQGRVQVIPGIPTGGEIDPVGAGDAADSALACALAVGADPLEAAELANLAAAVTVSKLRRTGTATPEEILRIYLQTRAPKTSEPAPQP
jgi:bifunctional ADP-heptose synthase (sugar kinase/adenylyltransferase)